jgi:hypothetical protein
MTEVVHIEDGIPPQLKPLIGRRVYRAWIMPQGRTLVLRLEGGWFLMVEAVATDIANQRLALNMEVGEEKPDADWGDLDVLPQTPHLKDLRGRRLTGLDAEVLVFDDRYGAKLGLDGIAWVKLAVQ